MKMVLSGLLAIGILMHVIAALFVICALALVLLILIQKGRGGGLSAAFGGGAAAGLLGSKTGDFLTWLTIVVVGVFLILAVIMAKFYRPSVTEPGGAQPPAPTAPAGQPPAGQPRPTLPQPKAPLAPTGDLGTEGSGTGDLGEVNLPGGG
jgi:preprotein translocase subunit SecG